MPKKASVFSFFSGIGILDLAFEKNGYNIVFVNEYEKLFLNAYKHARRQMNSKEPIYGYHNDSAERYAKRRGKKKLIRYFEEERQKGNLVGIIGGPPCPDFSTAGKNAGASGENGRLTKIYFDIICRCRPDFFLFENVKGLVRTQKHRVFYNEMKMKVQANGYVISEEVLNALAYGVPQYRERIMMIGIRKELCESISKGLTFDWAKHAKFDTNDILERNWPKENPFDEDSILEFNLKKIPKTLTVEYWFNKNDVENHPNAVDVFNVKAGRYKIETIAEGDTKGKSFKRLHRWRYSPTAAYGNNEVHLHPYKSRRISVAEAMAIQSLPKEFVVLQDIPLSKKFKMIGNGVPYRMSAAIAKTLKEVIDDMLEENHEKNCN